ncbi:MAG TPA: TlyA family RNA methyltransferase [Candidatus Binatia bacterium]|nr:TlyA family RNA methyltransferase [Candidatus Binatia bacterium]
MAQVKERLDKLLVSRGLAETRARAQALVMAGEVFVDGERADKPGMKVATEADLSVAEPLPYVSRGGYKLAEALARFEVTAEGRVCADVGACTGGFTDVLLAAGAARVYAIDVGYGQLSWKIRQDERVVVMERTNARYLEVLPEPVSLVVIDVSFISLRLILPAVKGWLAEGGEIVALVKPQFEAGREQVGKGGVVRDPAVHRQVTSDLWEWTAQRQLGPQDVIRSPIEGGAGNEEFLLWLQPGRLPAMDAAAAISRLERNG